jgi:predicted transcriptional regulator
MHRTVEIDEEQVKELEQLAARQHRTVDELVRQAVDGYLAQQQRDWSDWNERFDAFVTRVRSRIPAHLTPEEIEADITAARAEYRAEQAARRAGGGSDASGH